MNAPRTATWYFDFVSPFAYLQQERFDELPPAAAYEPKPIVLGAVLTHWGQKAPAEIAAKRIFTYRHAQYRADKLGIPFRMPPAHPFNPIRPLRLAIAMGNTPDAIRRIFRHIWRDGQDVSTPEGFAALCEAVGFPEGVTAVDAQAVKDALRANTDQAIAHSVVRRADLRTRRRPVLGRRCDRHVRRLRDVPRVARLARSAPHQRAARRHPARLTARRGACGSRVASFDAQPPRRGAVLGMFIGMEGGAALGGSLLAQLDRHAVIAPAPTTSPPALAVRTWRRRFSTARLRGRRGRRACPPFLLFSIGAVRPRAGRPIRARDSRHSFIRCNTRNASPDCAVQPIIFSPAPGARAQSSDHLSRPHRTALRNPAPSAKDVFSGDSRYFFPFSSKLPVTYLPPIALRCERAS